MDRIREMMDQLSELDDSQVGELQKMIVSEFESVEKEDPTPQTVDAMTSLADMLDSVRSEMKQREAAVQELAQRATEAASRVHGEDGDMQDGAETPAEEEGAPMTEAAAEPAKEEEGMPAAPVAEEAPAEAAPAPAPAPEGEVPMEEEKEDEEDMEKKPAMEASTTAEEGSELSTEEVISETSETTPLDNMEAPVTAAADNAETLDIEVPADRRPVAQATPAPVAITAGADIPGYTAGSSLEDMNAVSEAMAKRIHALRRVNGGDGEQHIVASITTAFPEERTLTTDTESNWNKIQNIISPAALTASGGHVAPFEVRYDIFGFGSTARPVRDALPRFQADRGGIRFITPPVLADYGSAVGVWTAANDADATPDPATKASLTVTAGAEITVATDAVTLQMQFGNLATRAYPELIARHNELGLIQHAREAEQQLLSRISTESTAVTTSSLIGFGRDFLVQVARAAVAYRSRHRLEADTPLRVIMPSWVKDAMAADLTLSMPGDNTLNAYGEIDGYLAARNVVVSYSLDQNVYSSQSVGTLNEFADSFTWYLFAEGTFLFLDGGTLDLGIIRDSTLVGTNDYKMFIETFEGIAKVGIESLAITSTISINGVAAALRDTTGGATAAAIEY